MQVRYSVLFCLLVTAMECEREPCTVVVSFGAFKLDYFRYFPEFKDYVYEFIYSKKFTFAKYLKPVKNMSIGTGPTTTPIWIENQNQGGSSALMNWPEAEWQNQKPYRYYNAEYDINSSRQAEINRRIRMIVQWIFYDKYSEYFTKPANLVMIYYYKLDEALRGNTVDSDKVQGEIGFAQYFIRGLIDSIMASYVNLIFLGSHREITAYQTGGPNALETTVDGHWRYTEDDGNPFNYPFFMAMGSNIVQQYLVPPLNTTDVNLLIRKLLKFPNNYQLSDAVNELFEPTKLSVKLDSAILEELFERKVISVKSEPLISVESEPLVVKQEKTGLLETVKITLTNTLFGLLF